MAKGKKKKPAIPKVSFDFYADPRVAYVADGIWGVRTQSDERVRFANLIEQRCGCGATGRYGCVHLTLARRERKTLQRRCRGIAGGIPDSDGLIIHALQRAYRMVLHG